MAIYKDPKVYLNFLALARPLELENLSIDSGEI